MSKDAQGRSIRRVSTGQAQGRLSVIARDEHIAPIESPLMPGAKFYSVWGHQHADITERRGGARVPHLVSARWWIPL
jgi:hypothetical protein